MRLYNIFVTYVVKNNIYACKYIYIYIYIFIYLEKTK